ncbi:MAG: NUDIX hydrolase, partial [Clostridia bacterium]|nr:NUDIX hydrolase [Clostridia bacterium]
EVREETGICRSTFTEFAVTVSKDTIFHEFLCVTDCDKDSITLQEGETVGFRWITEEELTEFRRSGEAIDSQMERYAPYFTRQPIY